MGFLLRQAAKPSDELDTVLNSTFCYKLHPLELCSLATNGTQERTPDTRLIMATKEPELKEYIQDCYRKPWIKRMQELPFD